ncbi:hypothetical protein CANMA_003862 [Candida margitis]|uniref:uncharacterized protein n=1 Tax=Candida margitis TaxID=1775924 RepID=UPI002225F118|nr:uncharacterized protein CANMA_003862 [Candida margitis]KAI5961088.1 hypothetical protein CANMA_003862 [Candida margitis]
MNMSTPSLDEEVAKFTSTLLSDIQSKSSIEIDHFKITKNDVIKSRIDKILTLFQADTPILLEGMTRDVQKLISIIEIAKQKHGSKVHQYNCLLRVRTRINPYKKQVNKGVEVVDFSTALKMTAIADGKNDSHVNEGNDDDDDDDGLDSEVVEREFPGAIARGAGNRSKKKEPNNKEKETESKTARTQEEKDAQKEIQGDKVYDIPVMYILLSGKDLSSYLDSDWTIQS